MTATEEIVVSGEDFIERRIFVYPERKDLDKLEHQAYASGYCRGWLGGFALGLAVFGIGVLIIWIIVSLDRW